MTIAAAVAAALIVAACSGSSGSSSTSVAIADEPVGTDVGSAGSAAEPVDDEPSESDSGIGAEVPTTAPAASTTRYGTGDSSFLFDPDVIHTFDIGLEPDALEELDRNPAAEEYVEGSLAFDGETLERVGVRYKGSVGAFLGCTAGPNPFVPSGPKTCTKLSLKLKINWDGSSTEFYGQRRVQLHAMNLDQSLLRERLGYQMFREAGVPASRATHARVNINGDFVGLFALVEQVDGRFARDRFADGTGNLYKEVWPFDDSGAVRDADALIDALKTNENEDPSVDIIQSFAKDLLDADAASDPEAARRVLAERTDLESLISYAVVDRAIRNDDGPFHWYCLEGPCEPHNFYLYEDPSSRRVHVIPWDLDNALITAHPITDIADPWGETRNDCVPFPFGPIAILQRSAACDPFVAAWSSLEQEYADAEAAFRSGPFAPDRLRALIDTWTAQIEPHVAEASQMYEDAPSVEEWRAAIDQLIDGFVVPAEQET